MSPSPEGISCINDSAHDGHVPQRAGQRHRHHCRCARVTAGVVRRRGHRAAWLEHDRLDRAAGHLVRHVASYGIVLAATSLTARFPRAGSCVIRSLQWQHGRVGISSTSIAHVRLTVTDIERSRQFYESVFGWPVLVEVPDNADKAIREQLSFLYGGVIYDLGGTLLGLRPVATDRFSEDRAALDHTAFRLGSLEKLESAATHLDGVGVIHEPIKDIGPSYILEFRDPDNIALELTAPK